MSIEEQLSSDLQSVKTALENLTRGIDQSTANQQKAPVPPSKDNVKVESTGPNMGDSKTVGQYKKLFEQVLGPSLSKTLEIKTEKNPIDPEMLSQQIIGLDNIKELDTETNRLLSEMFDVLSVNALNLETTLTSNSQRESDILQTQINSLVTQIMKISEPVDLRAVVESIDSSIFQVVTEIRQGQSNHQILSAVNRLVETGSDTTSAITGSESRVVESLNRLVETGSDTTSAITGSESRVVGMLTRLMDKTMDNNDVIKLTSQQLSRDFEESVTILTDRLMTSISTGDASENITELRDNLRQLIALNTAQKANLELTPRLLTQMTLLTNLSMSQLDTMQTSQELAKVEAQVVDEVSGVYINDIGRSALDKFADVLSVDVSTASDSKAQNVEKEDGSFLGDIMGTAITEMLGEGIGTLLAKSGKFLTGILGKTFSVVGGLFKPFAGAVSKIALGAASGIKSGLTKVFEVGKGILGKSYGFAKNMLRKTATSGKNMLGKIFGVKDGLLGKFFGFTKNLLTSTASKGKGMLSKVFNVKEGLLGKLFGFSKNLLVNTAGKMQGTLSKAFSFVPKLGGVGKSMSSIASKAGTSILSAVQGAIPAGGKLLGMVGKLAKFAGPIGAIVAGGMAVFDGVGAAMEEYKKSGSIMAAAREGVSSAMSTLTFGLVDQETFSGMFTAIGDGITAAGDWVSNQVGNAWEGVKNIASGNIVEGLGNVGEMLTFGLVDNETIKNALSSVSETFSKAGEWLSAGAGKVWDSITGFFTNSPDVWDVFDESGENLSAGTQKVAASTGRVVDQALLHSDQVEAGTQTVGSTVADMMNRFTPLGAIGDIVTGSISNIKDSANKLTEGAPMIDTAGDLLINQANTLLSGLGSLFTAPMDILSNAGGAIADVATGMFESVTGWFSDIETPSSPELTVDTSQNKQLATLMQNEASKSAESSREFKELTTRVDKLVNIQEQQLSVSITGNKQNLQSSQNLSSAIQKQKPGNTIISNTSNVSNNIPTDNNMMENFRKLTLA